MKLGAEPKQVAALAGILCLGAYFYFTSGPNVPPDAKGQQAKRTATVPPPSSVRQQPPKAAAAKRASTSLQDFKPSLKPPKEGLDPATVDPSLRSDLLAKVQKVNLAGGNRSLFDFGQAPIPKEPTPPKIIPSKNPLVDAVKASLGGPPAPPVSVTPPAPPKTPIPLKYYGFQGGPRQASKRAFFLEGDEIRIASEGELIGKRYKVVRIGLTSAVVEDTQQSYEQTLPLEEVQQGS